jgi:hypothetical protein
MGNGAGELLAEQPAIPTRCAVRPYRLELLGHRTVIVLGLPLLVGVEVVELVVGSTWVEPGRHQDRYAVVDLIDLAAVRAGQLPFGWLGRQPGQIATETDRACQQPQQLLAHSPVCPVDLSSYSFTLIVSS